MQRATEKGGKTVDLLGFHEVSAQDWLLPSAGASCIIPQESRGIVLWQGHTKRPQDDYTK